MLPVLPPAQSTLIWEVIASPTAEDGSVIVMVTSNVPSDASRIVTRCEPAFNDPNTPEAWYDPPSNLYS